MGVGGATTQGLWITTRDVTWAGNKTLTRISEVGVVFDFGKVTVPASGDYRLKGLHIGMQFRSSHQVGPAGSAGQIEFAAAPSAANFNAPGWVWTPVPQSTMPTATLPKPVTTRLDEVFSKAPGCTWRGYEIRPQMFAPYPAPGTVAASADERLYFRVTIRNFNPHINGGQYQKNDVHVVPMVCILADRDFATHYVLGLGGFTVGHAFGSVAFDSEVLTRDAPTSVPVAPMPIPPATPPKPVVPIARVRKSPPPRPLPRRRRPKPPRPGPGPKRGRARPATKRRKR